tara:strand:- start:5902 stop:6810 length:909 start_codon:yes stop_codon:yes gene_type:complete
MLNHIEQFKTQMLNSGIKPPSDIISDGEIHRFSTKDNNNDMAGWYVLYANNIPAGCFGNWRTGMVINWCAKSKDEMSAQEWSNHRQLIGQAKKQREKRQLQVNQQAAERAKYIWDNTEPANQEHPYLVNKRVVPFVARQRGNTLVLPIVNFEHEIQSLQFINPDGTKKLLSGGAKKSNFIPVSWVSSPKKILICEGYATGATLAAAYPDCSVVAAIDAGNLIFVSTLIRHHWPDTPMLICADDDRLTPGNPGITKAREAAIAAGADYTEPVWPKDAPISLSDFNDLINWKATRISKRTKEVS